MTRQHPLKQIDRPGFQRFRQQGMVGVGENFGTDAPGFFPIQTFLINQFAHQLRNRDRRMRVVQLDRNLGGEFVEVGMRAFITAHDILQ